MNAKTPRQKTFHLDVRLFAFTFMSIEKKVLLLAFPPLRFWRWKEKLCLINFRLTVSCLVPFLLDFHSRSLNLLEYFIFLPKNNFPFNCEKNNFSFFFFRLRIFFLSSNSFSVASEFYPLAPLSPALKLCNDSVLSDVVFTQTILDGVVLEDLFSASFGRNLSLRVKFREI